LSPWLNYNKKISFRDFHIFRNDRPLPRNGGGTMILCKKSLNSIPYNTDKISIAGCDLL